MNMNRIIVLAAVVACGPAFALPAAKESEGTGTPVSAKSDVDLARGLTAALLDDPQTPRVSGLSISIQDGRVTLNGAVRSQREKDIVTAKAGAVAGLRNVHNMIAVVPE